jgi:hypothetical protein
MSPGWQQFVPPSNSPQAEEGAIDPSTVKNLRWVILDDNLHQPVMIRAHPYPDILAFKSVNLRHTMKQGGAEFRGTAILWLQIPTHPKFNSLHPDHQKAVVAPPALKRNMKYHTGLVFALGVQFAGDSKSVMEMGLAYQNGLAILVSGHDPDYEYKVGRWHTPKGIVPEDQSLKGHSIKAPGEGCGPGLHFFVDQPSALVYGNNGSESQAPVITRLLRNHREGPCLVIASALVFLQHSFVCDRNGDIISDRMYRAEGSTSDKAEQLGIYGMAHFEFLSQIRHFSTHSPVPYVVSELAHRVAWGKTDATDKIEGEEDPEEDEEEDDDEKEPEEPEVQPLLLPTTDVHATVILPEDQIPEETDQKFEIDDDLVTPHPALLAQANWIARQFPFQSAQLADDPSLAVRSIEHVGLRNPSARERPPIDAFHPRHIGKDSLFGHDIPSNAISCGGDGPKVVPPPVGGQQSTGSSPRGSNSSRVTGQVNLPSDDHSDPTTGRVQRRGPSLVTL